MLYSYTLPETLSTTATVVQFTLITSMLIFCIATIIAIYRSSDSSKKSWYHIDQNEYNFMATEESEQSRLDLAQAYLDIGQTSDAHSILSELSQVKNPIIKERSKQLLKSINSTNSY